MFARVTVAFALAATAAGQYCPALSPDPHAPLSSILQDVCKRGEGGIDCRDIPDLLQSLASNGGPDAKNFELALKASAFMCDSCLDPIRQGLFYISDPPSKGHPNPEITDAGAQASACHCLPKYEALSKEFGSNAVKEYAKVAAACGKGDAHAVGVSVKTMMTTMFSSLESVRALAQNGFLAAEPRARVPQSTSSSKIIRAAAYGCLTLGTVLLAAAAVISRRPSTPLAERAPESELL